MAARQRLEMLGEGEVHRGAADRAKYRYRLRSDLLRDDKAETRGDLAHQAQQDRRGLATDAAHCDVAGRFAHRFREKAAEREIAAFDEIRRSGLAAERENFQAGERRLGIVEVLAFAPRDLGNGTQDKGRRDRQLDG